MEDQPYIVSVAVHYNTPEDCINLLQSLIKINYSNHCIVIVDNCSESVSYDKLLKFINDLKKSYQCELIRNKSNVGFGGGVNYGFNYALKKYKPKYLHVINTDAEIINFNYLKDLVAVLKSDKSIGIIGPAVLKEDHKELQNTILPFVSLRTALNFKNAFSNLSYVEQQPSIKDVECINGVCFVVPASVFESIGGFDQTYFMYGEEQDLCYKIFKKGLRRVFWSGLSILHYGAVKSNTYSIDWRYVFVRKNQIKFLRKHSSILNALTLTILFSVKTSIFYTKTNGDAYCKLTDIIALYFRSLRLDN